MQALDEDILINFWKLEKQTTSMFMCCVTVILVSQCTLYSNLNKEEGNIHTTVVSLRISFMYLCSISLGTWVAMNASCGMYLERMCAVNILQFFRSTMLSSIVGSNWESCSVSTVDTGLSSGRMKVLTLFSTANTLNMWRSLFWCPIPMYLLKKIWFLVHKDIYCRAYFCPGGVLRFELDRGVPLEPQNPYPSLRVILAEKGTHF